MIIAAACIIDDKVETLPPPARHHHILHKYPLSNHKHGMQGFIDDKWGFVNRTHAAQIALKEGQITKLQSPPRLFSEDLW